MDLNARTVCDIATPGLPTIPGDPKSWPVLGWASPGAIGRRNCPAGGSCLTAMERQQPVVGGGVHRGDVRDHRGRSVSGGRDAPQGDDGNVRRGEYIAGRSHPGGMTEISRWLSEAAPPEGVVLAQPPSRSEGREFRLRGSDRGDRLASCVLWHPNRDGVSRNESPSIESGLARGEAELRGYAFPSRSLGTRISIAMITQSASPHLRSLQVMLRAFRTEQAAGWRGQEALRMAPTGVDEERRGFGVAIKLLDRGSNRWMTSPHVGAIRKAS